MKPGTRSRRKKNNLSEVGDQQTPCTFSKNRSLSFIFFWSVGTCKRAEHSNEYRWTGNCAEPKSSKRKPPNWFDADILLRFLLHSLLQLLQSLSFCNIYTNDWPLPGAVLLITHHHHLIVEANNNYSAVVECVQRLPNPTSQPTAAADQMNRINWQWSVDHMQMCKLELYSPTIGLLWHMIISEAYANSLLHWNRSWIASGNLIKLNLQLSCDLHTLLCPCCFQINL